jgi:hypothetical protein
MKGDDERLIDKLVDGELSDADRRQLLNRLDAIPNGWRSCAIAFLEAQTWRQAMRSDFSGSAQGVTKGGAEGSQRDRSLTASRVVLALAATFLVAFALGRFARRPDMNSNGSAPALAHIRESANSPGSEKLQASQAAEDEPDPETSLRVVGLLSWMITQDGKEQKIAVPVVGGPGIDEEWLKHQPSGVPESVRRELERLGHRVVSNRRLVPIDLADGQRAILPIEQVEVMPAARVYQ